jgi:hypothetical protein
MNKKALYREIIKFFLFSPWYLQIPLCERLLLIKKYYAEWS